MKESLPGNFDIAREQLDAMKELINLGVGQGGEVLNSMLQSHISLSVPEIEVTDYEGLKSFTDAEGKTDLSAVEMKFQGSFTGSIHLVFPKTDASKLVSLLAEDERSEREMDAIRSDTLQEIGNVLLNAVMGTISNLFSFSLRYSLPLYIEGSPEDLYRSLKIGRPNIIIRALTRFTIDNMAVDGSLIFLFALRSFDALMSKVAIYSGTG